MINEAIKIARCHGLKAITGERRSGLIASVDIVF
jgi:hypothetical protein